MTQAASPLSAPIAAYGATMTFTVPVKVRQEKDPTTITLRTSFSLQTELDAFAEGKGDVSRTDYALLQRMIVKLDGKQVDQGSDFMQPWSPKVRLLARQALQKLTAPTNDEGAAFLDSGTLDV